MPDIKESRSYFLEARSDQPGAPSVLFNCGQGPISHVEVYSYMSGGESLRVIFRGEGLENTREYRLDGLRAKTFLRNLQNKGLWEPESETSRAMGAR
jgi:hypothetical protein